MQTLAVVDGDLALSAGGYLLLSGTNKVRQDLTLALEEEYGGDPYHPLWGSILNRYIGQPLTPSLQQLVSNEVQRVLRNYISVQADDVNAASLNASKANFDTSDVVQSIESIDVQISMDGIFISVVLQTMANQTLTIQRTVSR